MTAQQKTLSQLIELASPMPPFILELRQKIRAGKKTQTRRPLVPQPSSGVRKSPFVPSGFEDGHGRELKPKYPGGIRYLREPLIKGENGFAYYRDDNSIAINGITGQYVKWRWKKDILTQIFMPRELARFYFNWEVYRLQQIQAISNEDIKAEGIAYATDHGPLLHSMFKELWDGINADRGFAFADSPYVWAYKFSLYASFAQGEK